MLDGCGAEVDKAMLTELGITRSGRQPGARPSFVALAHRPSIETHEMVNCAILLCFRRASRRRARR